MNIFALKESLASCAIEGNEYAKEMLDLLDKVMAGKKVTPKEVKQLSDLMEKCDAQ
tara:strand:+ start:3923 stop:4090 length:168 start_codon:yes stop_codon:yes gene_type:complete